MDTIESSYVEFLKEHSVGYFEVEPNAIYDENYPKLFFIIAHDKYFDVGHIICLNFSVVTMINDFSKTTKSDWLSKSFDKIKKIKVIQLKTHPEKFEVPTELWELLVELKEDESLQNYVNSIEEFGFH